MSLVLIVDDVPAMREQYAYDLKRLGGHETLTASSGDEALEILARDTVDCVILDLEMPGMDGFAVLKRMRETTPDLPVIVYTGTGNFERCVRAVKLGAYSFIDKSESMEKVVREIDKALEKWSLLSEVERLRYRLGEEYELVGDSPSMRKLRDDVSRIAPIPSPVLILGESGTGKELVAREIHKLSGRARGPFVAINCAALPDTLVESELFGHEAGTFTGAGRTRKGAFEVATEGTLLLDEIGDLALASQAKLLRVLEERAVRRVGGSRAISIETRVLAATNRDLEAETGQNDFRKDLFFRINVHQVRVPPLREHLSDVPTLVEHFIRIICGRCGFRPKRITPETVQRLAGYSWKKNNVRELRNILERMIIATDGAEISEGSIPSEILDPETRGSGARRASGGLKELKLEAEREIVLAALERNQWQISKAAAELFLADHSSLLKIMRRHDLKRPT